MTIVVPPRGSRGKRSTPRIIATLVMPLMTCLHRRQGNTFAGMNLLYLTTVGAKSGQQRHHTVARFDDGQGGWLVVASAGGAAASPAWFHNIAANPDQVHGEVDGVSYHVTPAQLTGADYDRAWKQIVTEQKRFAGYAKATDRAIPVVRLVPNGSGQ